MSRSTRRPVLLAAIVAAVTLGAFLVLVRLAGASPAEALAAWARGAFGSPAAWGETLAKTTSLLLCALATTIAFRAGVLNIGAEGQLLAGAAAAAAVGSLLPASPVLARTGLVVASLFAGALAALPAAWLAEKRQAPAVLSTILLNLVAASTVTWLVRGPLRDPAGDYPQSRPLSDAVRLPPLVPGSRATAAVLVAFVMAIAVAVFLKKTWPGLALRATGHSRAAARAAGLPDVRIRVLAFAASGALAGLAGGLDVAALTGRLYDPFSPGTGYAGIAAALLGGLQPLGTAVAALGLASMGVGANALQRDAGVPSSLATIVPALAVLGLLLARGSSGDDPK
ncbi:MAG TPA: ABC transporter permease [Thermoanaerobaculia bacterium]|nr:ABC transporter permease [Thermoanaerobaculia bacterium]